MTVTNSGATEAGAAARAVGGDALPEQVVDITTTLIVGGALASRDFYLGHHDRDAAVAAGSKDVFMNVMTTLGLVERYVTGWAGPDVVLRAMSVKLGTSNYPGDRMVLSGEVLSAEQTDQGRVLRVAVTGMNDRGAHVRSAVELLLPRP